MTACSKGYDREEMVVVEGEEEDEAEGGGEAVVEEVRGVDVAEHVALALLSLSLSISSFNTRHRCFAQKSLTRSLLCPSKTA